MLSDCNNLLPIKKFLVETGEWKNTETDISIFNLVRGLTKRWGEMQKYVDGAIEGREAKIGDMKICCIKVDEQAIKANIISKQAEIENLRKMLE